MTYTQVEGSTQYTDDGDDSVTGETEELLIDKVVPKLTNKFNKTSSRCSQITIIPNSFVRRWNMTINIFPISQIPITYHSTTTNTCYFLENWKIQFPVYFFHPLSIFSASYSYWVHFPVANPIHLKK